MEYLKPAPVKHDAEGYWKNPGIPDFGPPDDPRYAEFATAQKLAFCLTYFTDDAPKELINKYCSSAPSPLAEWVPTPPAGPGWFVWAISPSHDGPICWWCRRMTVRLIAAQKKRSRQERKAVAAAKPRMRLV